MSDNENKKGCCMAPDCDRTIYSRGLCVSHYNMANRLVLREQTTWETLIETGKCLDTKGKQGKRTGAVEWFLNEERIQEN